MASKATIGRVAAVTGIITAAALVIAAGIGFATGGFFPTGRVGGSMTVDERRTVSLDGADLLAISATSENVTIVEGSGAAAEAWLHGKVSAGSRDAVPTLVVSRSGTRAEIRLDHRLLDVGPMWGALDLEVRVPSGYAKALTAGTSSGEIALTGHGGTTVVLSAASGDVQVSEVKATDLTAKTSSGRVRLDAVKAARVSASATSGDIGLGTVEAQELTVHTGSGGISADPVTADRAVFGATSGDISVTAAGGDVHAGASSGRVGLTFSGQPSRVDVSVTSGDVVVRLPSSARFSLDARAASGDVRCAFPITIEGGAAAGHHSLSGTVGTPAGSVTIRTSSGSISVEKE